MGADDGRSLPGMRAQYPASERFCKACGMPLVHVTGGAEQAVLSERQRGRARSSRNTAKASS